MEQGNGNGVALSRLSVPAIQAFLVIVAAISVAGTFVAIWLGIIGRIAAVEVKVENVSSRVLGDRYPGWHRLDQYIWCLKTEQINNGWQCADPYLIPSVKEEAAKPLLRQQVNTSAKADRH